MVTTLVSLLYFVMTLSMIIINSSNMSIHGTQGRSFTLTGPGVEPAGGRGSELRAMGKLHMTHVLKTCFIQILLWFVLVFPVYKKWCFFLMWECRFLVRRKNREFGKWYNAIFNYKIQFPFFCDDIVTRGLVWSNGTFN